MKKALVLLAGMSALDTASARSPIRVEHGQNLLTNGDFDQNICKQDWCIFNAQTPNAVTAWTPDPQIQVGYGTIYNHRLGRDRVVQLTPNQNSCIKQTVHTVRPGAYKLEVVYAAREGRPLDDSQFSIQLNGKILKSLQPADYQIRSEIIDLNFNSRFDAEVRLCGIGEGQSNNSVGVSIKEVKLTSIGNGFNQGFGGFGQGFGQGLGQGSGLGFPQGNGFGQGLNPTFDQGFGQGPNVFGQNFAQGAGQGFGLNQGFGQGFNTQFTGSPLNQGSQPFSNQQLNPSFGGSFNQLGNLGNGHVGNAVRPTLILRQPGQLRY